MSEAVFDHRMKSLSNNIVTKKEVNMSIVLMKRKLKNDRIGLYLDIYYKLQYCIVAKTF